jgi:hypothetical protein
METYQIAALVGAGIVFVLYIMRRRSRLDQ